MEDKYEFKNKMHSRKRAKKNQAKPFYKTAVGCQVLF